jgi:hypothetical protein
MYTAREHDRLYDSFYMFEIWEIFSTSKPIIALDLKNGF